MSLSTGISRLDDLLSGGLPERSFTLLHGPPFLGKDVLADRFLIAGIEAGQPAILVCTNESWTEARDRLNALTPKYAEAEMESLVHFVDAYSYQLDGSTADLPEHVHMVEGVQNLSDVAYALNEAHRALAPDARTHRLVLDSLSTIVAQTNAQTTFRFLQSFIARARRAGATGAVLLEQGMHAPSDVEAFKSLHHGVIEMKRDNEKPLLRVEGLGVLASPGWIEFRQRERQLEIVGSFAGGRVR